MRPDVFDGKPTVRGMRITVGHVLANLAAESLASMIVSVSGHGGTGLTSDKTSRTLHRRHWSTAQMATVTAAEDADAMALAHAAADTDLAVTDDYTAGPVVSTACVLGATPLTQDRRIADTVRPRA